MKNPKRVAAGRLNRKKRGELSAEARQRLRDAAHKNRPWEKSTGPTTIEGKKRCAMNSRLKYSATTATPNPFADRTQFLRNLIANHKAGNYTFPAGHGFDWSVEVADQLVANAQHLIECLSSVGKQSFPDGNPPPY